MSTSGSGPETADGADRKGRQDLLLKVYETAVAEYRFNVQMTWDRAKFFLTLSVSAIAAGVGLLKLALDNGIICLFLASYFFLLFWLTRYGAETQRRGKTYTRQAQLTMTLAQRELGLYERLPQFDQPDLHLGLAVTPGQRDVLAIIIGQEQREAKTPDRGSIVRVTVSMFSIVMAIELIGMAICIAAAIRAVPTEWWRMAEEFTNQWGALASFGLHS